MTRQLWMGVVLLLASLGIGFAAVGGHLIRADVPLFKALALTHAHSPDWAVAIAQVATRLGDPSVRSLIVIAALVLLVWRRNWREAVVYLVTVALAIAGHSVMKEGFARDRPHLVPWLDQVDTYAYPSGHAAGTMVVLLLGALLLGGRQWVVTAVLLSIAVGLSRVALGMHWPSDVAGGWMFGEGAALIGWSVARWSQPGPVRR